MVWAPGQSGNPKGYSGPRNRRRHEVFDQIKGLGHKDALETLSYLQHNEQIEPGLRIAAASALAPFCHPKMQATPTPRFIDTPLDIPHFERLSDAENFLARLPVLVARGELDFQSAQELAAMTKLWIDSQYFREELAIKQINAGTTEHEQVIRVEGGLPPLPGTSIVMPVLDGNPASNGHAALAAPTDAVPAIESTPSQPSKDSTNGNCMSPGAAACR
jgi:hypothetical protein